MNYQKITTHDVANGPGIRVVLWVSGCSHECKGCHNPKTWDSSSGELFTSSTLSNIIDALSPDYVSGLTLSGGDPLFIKNRESILKLVKLVKLIYPNKSIWLYTGYYYESILGNYILDYIDVVVDGPYIDSLKDVSLPYCGSKNQRVIDVRKSKDNHRIVLWQPDK